MNVPRQVSLLVAIAAISFSGLYLFRLPQRSAPRPAEPAIFGDSSLAAQRLERIGLTPGRRLTAYFFGGSGCGSCRSEPLKTALAALRDSLQRAHGDAYTAVSVVGVAIDGDIEGGLDYLRSIGLASFDEVSTGNGWTNEHVTRLIWRDSLGRPSAPQVIVLAHSMTATLGPLTLRFGSDSVVGRMLGYDDLLSWVSGGTMLPFRSERPKPPAAIGGAISPSNVLTAQGGPF